MQLAHAHTLTTIPFTFGSHPMCAVFFFSCSFSSCLFLFYEFKYRPLHISWNSLACPQICRTEHFSQSNVDDQRERNCVVVRFSFIKSLFTYIMLVCSFAPFVHSQNQKYTLFVMQKIISTRNSRVIEKHSAKSQQAGKKNETKTETVTLGDSVHLCHAIGNNFYGIIAD